LEIAERETSNVTILELDILKMTSSKASLARVEEVMSAANSKVLRFTKGLESFALNYDSRQETIMPLEHSVLSGLKLSFTTLQSLKVSRVCFSNFSADAEKSISLSFPNLEVFEFGLDSLLSIAAPLLIHSGPASNSPDSKNLLLPIYIKELRFNYTPGRKEPAQGVSFPEQSWAELIAHHSKNSSLQTVAVKGPPLQIFPSQRRELLAARESLKLACKESGVELISIDTEV